MEETMEIVSLDFDNVLYDLEELDCRMVKEIYGVDITPMDVVHWDFYSTNYPEINKIWGNWELYSQGLFFDGDIDFIKELQKRYEVQIVTASYPEIEMQKDEMILERYGDLRIIHSGKTSKALYTGGSILVDDGLHNISAHIEEHSLPAIVVDRGYGWNQGFEHELVHRADDFEEIKRLIYSLAKGK